MKLVLYVSIDNNINAINAYLSFRYNECLHLYFVHSTVKQKQKYRGMFETQKSRSKTISGDIGLNIRTLASPKWDRTRCPEE